MSNVSIDLNSINGHIQSSSNKEPTETQNGSVLDVLNITNSILAILIIYVLFKLFGTKKRTEERSKDPPLVLPDPLPKHDMTLDELRKYNGQGPDKRICIAILGRVYDCTKGYNFYKPGGAYSTFAGRDASRALAKFDVMAVKDEWDDITDLDQNELSLLMEWNEQFQEKYDYVGRLVRSQEEILEKPDFEENLINDDEKQNEINEKSLTDDDEIEVINNEESTNNEPTVIVSTYNKKVSFEVTGNEKTNENKLSDFSDEIEMIENKS